MYCVTGVDEKGFNYNCKTVKDHEGIMTASLQVIVEGDFFWGALKILSVLKKFPFLHLISLMFGGKRGDKKNASFPPGDGIMVMYM